MSPVASRRRQRAARHLKMKIPALPFTVTDWSAVAPTPHPDRKRAQTDIAAWTAMPGRILSVAARFPLCETAAAHKAVEAGGKVGTVVVEPQH